VVLFRGEEVGRVVDRLRRRGFTPGVPTPAPAGWPRWLRAALVVFVGWHGGAMTINALSYQHTRLEVPPALRRATHTYGRVTNTYQFWRMFAPNAPGFRYRLDVDVIDRDGGVHPSRDDRSVVDARRAPYVLIDRREKVNRKILGKEPLWRERHAAHLCRTWRGADGRGPAEIVFRRRSGPTPSPWDLATIPAGEEEAWIRRAARAHELLRYPCDPEEPVDTDR
jgi:hypothetical protein